MYYKNNNYKTYTWVVSGGRTTERRHQAGDNNIVKAGGLGGPKTRDNDDGAMNHCLEKLKLKIIRRRCGLLYIVHTRTGEVHMAAAHLVYTGGDTRLSIYSGWYHFCPWFGKKNNNKNGKK